MTVVFSTYQSIDVIAKAQKALIKNGFKEFDLIICDEAHRTTGVTLSGEDESDFTKVHDANFIKAKKTTSILFPIIIKRSRLTPWILYLTIIVP